jgi:radical SAM superfamily enzyme YgiQ (UPF0313 family)
MSVPGRDMARAWMGFDQLCRLRNEVFPPIVDQWAKKIAWQDYNIVGTSTFEQNTPALALARPIKENQPKITIVFGGANFDGGMGKEYIRALPFIDYVVVGEGDESFPQLVDCIARGADALECPELLAERMTPVEGRRELRRSSKHSSR